MRHFLQTVEKLHTNDFTIIYADDGRWSSNCKATRSMAPALVASGGSEAALTLSQLTRYNTVQKRSTDPNVALITGRKLKHIQRSIQLLNCMHQLEAKHLSTHYTNMDCVFDMTDFSDYPWTWLIL